MYNRNRSKLIFPDDIFNEILNSQNNKVFSIDLSDLDALIDEIFKLNLDKKPIKQPEDMINKKPILPQHDSKYRVIKKSANAAAYFHIEFSNPTKLSEPVWHTLPGDFAFDTLEEAKLQIEATKKTLQPKTEIVYEE